jgi:hypothetical protein
MEWTTAAVLGWLAARRKRIGEFLSVVLTWQTIHAERQEYRRHIADLKGMLKTTRSEGAKLRKLQVQRVRTELDDWQAKAAAGQGEVETLKVNLAGTEAVVDGMVATLGEVMRTLALVLIALPPELRELTLATMTPLGRSLIEKTMAQLPPLTPTTAEPVPLGLSDFLGLTDEVKVDLKESVSIEKFEDGKPVPPPLVSPFRPAEPPTLPGSKSESS